MLAVGLLAGVTSVVAGVPSATPASAATTSGYWLVGTDGGIFSYGKAGFFGSTGAIKLNQPIVGMAATPDGKGYWMVASDGGIFAFGDAPFYGSMGATKLNKPIVDIVPTPSGRGYWMAASDGGIFAFGDAGFFGSTGAIKLTKRIQQMASTPTGRGYWMVAGDGGVFAFGDAGFFGSAAEGPTEKRIVDIAPSASGKGYYITASNGDVFAYGDAKFYGSIEGQKLAHGIISMVALNNGEAPVAADDVLALDEDGQASIDVLANDRDPDGDPLTIQSIAGPGKGTVTVSGRTVTYRPAPDANGADSFTYTIADERGNTATARVNISIRGVDDLPRTADDTAVGDEDVSFGIDVLSNDSGLGDGVSTLTIVQGPKLGTATVLAGHIHYIPKPEVSGADSLRYRVTDSDGDNVEGAVKITIRPVNDLPAAADDVFDLQESDSSLVGAVLGNDIFGETDSPDIRLLGPGDVHTGQVENGDGTKFEVDGDRIKFTPGSFSGAQASVRYVVIDDNKGSGEPDVSLPGTATFRLPNHAPTAGTIDVPGVLEGQTVNGELVGGDRETPGQLTFRFEGTGVPTLNGRAWSWTAPTIGVPQDYIFTYVVSDGVKETSGTLTIRVSPAPPA
ncbi:MAG TPA: Ig-like domain-containing protein [Acidimicrobiia bacterium]|nr:Ig-like domain-containing protein [Acidimicrobiia bacterium]